VQQSDRSDLTVRVAADHGRFVVVIDRPLISAARKVGVSVTADLTRSLDVIGRLLPGPATDIDVVEGSEVIPHTGVMGLTGPYGAVQLTLDTHQTPGALRRTLRSWLLQDPTHEVDHSVRIEAGPGCWPTLLDQLVCEGVATAFDIEVQPSIDLPWTHVLTAGQERAMWDRARPLLNQTGLYDHWFLGGGSVPHWTAFQIGYDIARDYLARHPRSTAASLVDKPAAVLLAGSRYHG
jgi:hypothetical protein